MSSDLFRSEALAALASLVARVHSTYPGRGAVNPFGGVLPEAANAGFRSDPAADELLVWVEVRGVDGGVVVSADLSRGNCGELADWGPTRIDEDAPAAEVDTVLQGLRGFILDQQDLLEDLLRIGAYSDRFGSPVE